MKKKRSAPFQQSLIDPDEILADSISALNVGGTIWEGKIEKPIGRMSSLIFFMLIVAAMGYLALRAATLQIVRGNDLYVQSQENRFLTRFFFPPRGIFYDKNHMPLVENIPTFSILFEKDIFLNAIAVPKESAMPCVSNLPRPYESSIKNGGHNVSSVPCAPRKSIHPQQQLKDMISLMERF